MFSGTFMAVPSRQLHTVKTLGVVTILQREGTYHRRDVDMLGLV